MTHCYDLDGPKVIGGYTVRCQQRPTSGSNSTPRLMGRREGRSVVGGLIGYCTRGYKVAMIQPHARLEKWLWTIESLGRLSTLNEPRNSHLTWGDAAKSS